MTVASLAGAGVAGAGGKTQAPRVTIGGASVGPFAAYVRFTADSAARAVIESYAYARSLAAGIKWMTALSGVVSDHFSGLQVRIYVAPPPGTT